MTQKEKNRRLKEQGVLNKEPGKVKEPLFQSNSFFDPNDLAQVKYEMVRQATHEGKSVSESSAAFGMSRPSFYQAKEVIESEGMLGLAPKKTGPKTRHKLTAEIMEFIKESLAADSTLSSTKLVELVKKKFAITVHRRSIDRALAVQKKMYSPESKR